ncbi:MAG: adenylosuccinate lyase [Chloroflexota bacterium]
MADTFTHDTYLSPYTWRYGTDAMRRIWSLENQRLLWRTIWVALAQAQQEAGLVTQAQVDDLRANADKVDIPRAHELEAELKHDLMAEVHTYAEQCGVGGGIIHLGATSMDIEDNAEALRLREACDDLLDKLAGVLAVLADRIITHADTVCMAFTHIQPAEPTTVGYRLAFTAQDLLADYETLRRVRDSIRGKGLKGAVGTSASYGELLNGTGITPRELEANIMAQIDLEPFPVAHQTYTRRQDFEVVNALASIAMTVNKFAFDLRLLQSPVFGEWGEPFGKKQIGSSAMPFKRNPINAENMNSLARLLAAMPRVMWDNAANSLLERTLDDSGNRRTVLPEAFLITDELLKRTNRLLSGMSIDDEAIRRNMATYGVFAATERVLMAAVRNGGNRQELHEVIRQHSLNAWAAIRQGQPNPLAETLVADEAILSHLDGATARELLNADDYVGDAPERAREMVNLIRQAIAQEPESTHE